MKQNGNKDHKRRGKKKVRNTDDAMGNGWLIWDETGKQKEPAKQKICKKLFTK